MADILTRKDFDSKKDWEDYLETIKEIEMETEKYDYDPDSAKLRSPKDKKFMGHTPNKRKTSRYA